MAWRAGLAGRVVCEEMLHFIVQLFMFQILFDFMHLMLQMGEFGLMIE